jgi:hypothetical protein
MFDPEQYTNTPYHSRHMDPTYQPALFPYIYPGFNSTTTTPTGKNENYICKWIDHETNRICNQTFPHMQDIGKHQKLS